MAVTKLCSVQLVWHQRTEFATFRTHLSTKRVVSGLRRSNCGITPPALSVFKSRESPKTTHEAATRFEGRRGLRRRLVTRAWSRNVKDGSDEVEDDDDDIQELSMASGTNGVIYKVEESSKSPREPVMGKIPRRSGPKWPLWLVGPLALLASGAVPALWLPTPALFSGSTIAGILSLAGLDCTFYMGSTIFLLAADACARSSRNEGPPGVVTLHSITPRGYKVWSLLVSVVGLLGPVVAFTASWHGLLVPEASFLPWAAVIGPYTLLLVVQMCVENLVWRWQSPVWPVVPLVYQGYRIFQLSRGTQLGLSLNAPPWLIQVAKGFVSWWVLVLGMQLMWVAWLTGSTRTRSSKQPDPAPIPTFAMSDSFGSLVSNLIRPQ